MAAASNEAIYRRLIDESGASSRERVRVVVVGAGQAGLAIGYHLKR